MYCEISLLRDRRGKERVAASETPPQVPVGGHNRCSLRLTVVAGNTILFSVPTWTLELCRSHGALYYPAHPRVDCDTWGDCPALLTCLARCFLIHLPLTPCFICKQCLSLSGLQQQPESNEDPHRFHAHRHWCRRSRACQVPHAGICSVWSQFTPAYLFSRHSCPCHPSIKLEPLPEGDALLSWSQGCLALHSLADSLLWKAGSCLLPGKSLRNREARTNPSSIEEERCLPMYATQS